MHGLCDICGKVSATLFTCSLCGKRVCGNCYDPKKGICKICLGGFRY